MMDEDRTSLSGTHSNDTIIELTRATANENDTKLEKDVSEEEDDPSTKKNSAGPSLEEGRAAAVVAPGFLLLDLLRVKGRRKLGHRRVNEEGEVTFKKIQSSWIVGSIQLGMGHAVGSLAHHPERDLLMMDFALVETIAFPRDGSSATPAHRFSDFKFRSYAPVAFRYFRDLFGIRPEDFLVSLCSRPLLQLTNPGASGSIFYVTHDDNFVIKTVDHREADFLQKLLPGYYMNINQNPRTLLPKFFGLYCYQCSNKNVRLVVMNNLLPQIKLHDKYDLKGSTYKRRASKQERKKSSPTYKDLDFVERHPEGILLEHDTYTALINTLKRDCRVLESFKIMDYSLLVGVHNMDADRPETEEKKKLQPLARAKSLNRPRLAAFSTALESIRADVDVPEEGSEEQDVPPGGIPARNAKGERLLLFLGIIDILQSFVLKKKLEHTFKAIVHDGDTVSVHKPGFYAQRFLDFMSNTVFRKTPSPLKHTPSRRKGRKTSTAAQRTDARDADPGTSFQSRSDQIAGAGTSFDTAETSEEPASAQPDLIASRSDPQTSIREAVPMHSDPGPSSRTREDPTSTLPNQTTAKRPYQIRSSEAVGSYLSKPGPSVTFAETDVLELSQIVIETTEAEGPSVAVWTPPGGSTPTHTEGTPSFTESSPSPTTPSTKGSAKSFDSLDPLDETRVH